VIEGGPSKLDLSLARLAWNCRVISCFFYPARFLNPEEPASLPRVVNRDWRFHLKFLFPPILVAWWILAAVIFVFAALLESNILVWLHQSIVNGVKYILRRVCMIWLQVVIGLIQLGVVLCWTGYRACKYREDERLRRHYDEYTQL
jgi:hypothetical protein